MTEPPADLGTVDGRPLLLEASRVTCRNCVEA
jgi:hypothetical protein